MLTLDLTKSLLHLLRIGARLALGRLHLLGHGAENAQKYAELL